MCIRDRFRPWGWACPCSCGGHVVGLGHAHGHDGLTPHSGEHGADSTTLGLIGLIKQSRGRGSSRVPRDRRAGVREPCGASTKIERVPEPEPEQVPAHAHESRTRPRAEPLAEPLPSGTSRERFSFGLSSPATGRWSLLGRQSTVDSAREAARSSRSRSRLTTERL